MPHIAVSFYPGRSEETKQDIADKMAGFFCSTFDVDPGAVSVTVEDIAPEEFVPTVEGRHEASDFLVSSRVLPSEQLPSGAPTSD